MDLQIEYLSVDSLKPYERNARAHKKEDVAAIAASIREFGFDDPIGIWGKENIIVEGHGRLLAAKEIGMETVPVVRLDHLTDEQRRAYALAHNKTAELSSWDDDLLNLELDDIDIDMGQFGFDTTDDEAVVEDDYEVSLPEEPKAKRGDIYQLGNHRLMCGDSTVLDDVEKLVGGVKMDLFITDPPYNVDYEGTAGKILNDKMDSEKFRAFCADSFTNAATVMNPGSAFYIWHSDGEPSCDVRNACRDAGFRVRQCLIWEKNSFTLGRQDFQWLHEPCLYGEEEIEEEDDAALYGWKDGGRHYFYKNRKQQTILKYDKPKSSAEHPTMKPVQLFGYQIQCSTQKGGTVLDLFTGSGTTIIAAEQTGRNAFCMELDPKFVDVIIDRWETFTGERARLLNGEDRETAQGD